MCERYIDQLPLTRPQLGTQPATQACALTGNRTRTLVVLRLVLHPVSHTCQGCALYSFIALTTMNLIRSASSPKAKFFDGNAEAGLVLFHTVQSPRANMVNSDSIRWASCFCTPPHNSISTPTLQMKRLRDEEIRYIAQVCEAGLTWNPGSLAPEPTILTSVLS